MSFKNDLNTLVCFTCTGNTETVSNGVHQIHI